MNSAKLEKRENNTIKTQNLRRRSGTVRINFCTRRTKVAFKKCSKNNLQVTFKDIEKTYVFPPHEMYDPITNEQQQTDLNNSGA
uniref:Uncharacterized protein n=1 Tax=Romanomermis culicivorax TaxID=13658 RepID=A0A915HRC4_ROMCU